MSNETEHVELLIQIRDLLIPIAHHHRPEYENYLKREAKKAVLRRLVRRGKPVEAAKLMNGATSRAEIVKASKIDPSDMSKLLTTLRENDLLKSEVNGPPHLIFTQEEVEETYKSE